MEIKATHVFQADSEAVNEVYNNQNNYLIEYNKEVPEEYCVLYFSSNDLYYPNNNVAFSESVIKKNRFEWYGNRIHDGYKHIFIRDIKKQWYLTGINGSINSPEKLLEFLKKETAGFKVIALGSSAGGFASVIYGQLLDAKHILTFNGQFEILSLLKSSTENIDPVIFRNQNNPVLLPYYDTINFIKKPASIFYFHSAQSQWDINQSKYVAHIELNKISFQTNNHGIPFLKSNLEVLLNMSDADLRNLSGKSFHPLFFSLKMVGFYKTIIGLVPIVKYGFNKIYIMTIQKLKK